MNDLELQSDTPEPQPSERPSLREHVQALVGRFTLEKHEAKTCREYLSGIESPHTYDDVNDALLKYGIQPPTEE